MFDFFKYMYGEVKGIDLESEKKEKARIKKIEMQEKGLLFSSFTRGMIIFMGIAYVLVAVSSMVTLMAIDYGNWILIFKYFILALCDIICIVCLIIKKRQTELLAAILIVVFVIFQVVTSMIII